MESRGKEETGQNQSLVKEMLSKIVNELRGSGKDKKIIDIEEYINDKFNDTECELIEAQDLLKYSNLPFQDDDFDALFGILHQTYSRGEPYFLFEIESVNVLQNNLIENIKKHFLVKQRYSVCRKYEFAFEKVAYNDSNSAAIRIKYKQFQVISTTDGLQSGNELRYGHFDCEFMFDKNMLLIGTGNRMLAKAFFDYLTSNFYMQINLVPFKLMQHKFNYNGPMDGNRLTIFFLELVTNYIKDNTHIINDYKKIGFYNSRGQQVKNIKLAGNDLLNSLEVAEQVKNGLTLKLVEFNMTWIVNSKLRINADIVINSESIMKIIIKEINIPSYKTEILMYVYNKIKNLTIDGISYDTAASITDNYINKVVKKQKIEKSVLIGEIRLKLLEEPQLKPLAMVIDTILNEFR